MSETKNVLKKFTLWEKVFAPNLLFQALWAGMFAGVLVVCFKLAVEKTFGVVDSYVLSSSWRYKWFFLPLLTALGGGLAGWVVFRFAPETSGSGIPYIKAVLSRVGLSVRLRSLFVKFLSGVLGIGTGMPLGREGPSVQLGAAAGAFVAKIFRRDGTQADCLIAAGSGAALGAVFNAPIAGTIFVFEELLHKFSAVLLFPVLVATVTAASVMRFFLGNHPSFDVPFLSETVNWPCLLICVLLGAVLGAMAKFFSLLIIYFRKKFSSFENISPCCKTAFAGGVVGIIALFVPLAMGAGNEAVELLLFKHLSWEIILLVLGIRFVLTPLCFGSGVAGGIFLPMLMIGSFSGYLMAFLADIGGINVNYVVVSLAGMAAFMAAVARTPLTAVVMVFEMTGGYGYILPIMLSTAMADLVAARLGHKPIYTILQHNYMQTLLKHPNLQNVTIRDVMKKVSVVLTDDLSLNEVYPLFSRVKVDTLPIVRKDNTLIGQLSRMDIETVRLEQMFSTLCVKQIMNPDAMVISLDSDFYQVYFDLHECNQTVAFVVDENNVLQGIVLLQELTHYILDSKNESLLQKKCPK